MGSRLLALPVVVVTLSLVSNGLQGSGRRGGLPSLQEKALAAGNGNSSGNASGNSGGGDVGGGGGNSAGNSGGAGNGGGSSVVDLTWRCVGFEAHKGTRALIWIHNPGPQSSSGYVDFVSADGKVVSSAHFLAAPGTTAESVAEGDEIGLVASVRATALGSATANNLFVAAQQIFKSRGFSSSRASIPCSRVNHPQELLLRNGPPVERRTTQTSSPA